MDANESPQTARDCVNRATATKCSCCDRKCTKLWQDLLRSMMDQVKAGIRTVMTVLLAWIMLVLFFFAGISYGEKQYWVAIVSMGAISIILLAVQTASTNTLKPGTWNWRTAIPTSVVGLATHYSALVIGVSFVGASYRQEINFTWDIIAVLVVQGVLTSAACILVNRFRQRDAVQRNPDAQRG